VVLVKEEKYKKILQDLKSDFHVLMSSYLQNLHDSIHEDLSRSLSHVDIAKKIKNDCLSIFSHKLDLIAFDERSEVEVANQILAYNYDMEDIKYMKEVEQVDLYPIADELNEYCLKHNDPRWFTFGIHELLQNGNVDLGARGSKRLQFCRWCGEGIYLSSDHVGSKHHSSKKDGPIK
jgi:hypothetical protein